MHDDRGRMVAFQLNGTDYRQYRHNGRGERVSKLNPATPTSSVHYVYDEAGHLIGEYQPDGTRIREYIWLDDTLVAVRANLNATTFQYVLTDHLGTPRAIVHPTTNAILWRWDLTPSAFGDHAAQTDPDGNGVAYTFNLRYPGQYYDEDTGLHYNYFRDYDPSTGRYLQSDPIGLAGGVATFSYVSSSPIQRTDPLGLYSPEGHFRITFAAAMAAGARPSQAAALAWQVANADWEPSMEVSQAPENSYQHAMCPVGTPTEVCEDQFRRLLEEGKLSNGSCPAEEASLAQQIHALQDSFALGHKGFQSFNGDLLDLPPHHALGDWVPMPRNNTRAAIETTRYLQRRAGPLGAKGYLSVRGIR